MKEIKITRVHAGNDDDLAAELNAITAAGGRIISTEAQLDDWHKIVYEQDDSLLKG